MDYALRAQYLDGLHDLHRRDGATAVCAEILQNLSDGRGKLWTMHRALDTRNKLPHLFRLGEYIPLTVEGEKQQHVIAFLRRDTATKQTVLVAVPRFSCTLMQAKPHLPLADAWGKATLSLPQDVTGSFKNIFTDAELKPDDGGVLSLHDIFAEFPVAMLVSNDQ